jgi:transposase
MASYGHEVLRLLPYHPELNPIEKIWASVKNWVAVHNTTFKLKDVEQLARRRFSEITADNWRTTISLER